VHTDRGNYRAAWYTFTRHKSIFKNLKIPIKKQLLPIAGPSKAQVFSPLIAGIAGLNPDGGINICFSYFVAA
jgi:hypothetical protein